MIVKFGKTTEPVLELRETLAAPLKIFMKILYNKTTFTRNIAFYLIGVIFYFLIYRNFSFFNFFIGMFGFVLAYNSIYFFNDLIDYNKDKADKFRRKIKPLITGKFSFETAVMNLVLCLIIGISLSFYISFSYGILVMFLILLCYLHTTFFKKIGTLFSYGNMVFIQIIKFSTGWFAFTTTMINYPFFIILAISFGYTFSYHFWKNQDQFLNISKKTNIVKLKESLSKKINILFLTAIFGSFLASFLLYKFTLPIIVFLAISLCALGAFEFVKKRYAKQDAKTAKIGNIIGFFAIVSLMLMLVLMLNPATQEINDMVCKPFEQLRENITSCMPQPMIKAFDNLNDYKIKDITEVTEPSAIQDLKNLSMEDFK